MSDTVGNRHINILGSETSGRNSIVDDPLQQETPLDRLTIRTNTLSDFCAETGLDNVDFIKIDAEGHDFQVIKGAESLLRTAALARSSSSTRSAGLTTGPSLRTFALVGTGPSTSTGWCRTSWRGSMLGIRSWSDSSLRITCWSTTVRRNGSTFIRAVSIAPIPTSDPMLDRLVTAFPPVRRSIRPGSITAPTAGVLTPVPWRTGHAYRPSGLPDRNAERRANAAGAHSAPPSGLYLRYWRSPLLGWRGRGAGRAGRYPARGFRLATDQPAGIPGDQSRLGIR